jgi:PhnB protein
MKLTPYLFFNGKCEEAINFYKQALGGEILQLSKMGDAPGMEVPEHQKNLVMHAALKFGDNELLMSDQFDNPTDHSSSAVTLSLHPNTVEEEQAVFSKLSEGGNITQPIVETFWGARFGMLVDKFGIHWMFNTQINK